MKSLLLLGCLALLLGMTGCASTQSSTADYINADRSDAAVPCHPVTTSTEVVSLPEPAPIPTKNVAENRDLDHTTPDQPLITR